LKLSLSLSTQAERGEGYGMSYNVQAYRGAEALKTWLKTVTGSMMQLNMKTTPVRINAFTWHF